MPATGDGERKGSPGRSPCGKDRMMIIEERRTRAGDEYTTPVTPPATPPTIDPAVRASDAASLPRADGDSDFPGNTPPETFPDDGDVIEPTGPSEIEIEREDVDEPGQGGGDEIVPPRFVPPPD